MGRCSAPWHKAELQRRPEQPFLVLLCTQRVPRGDGGKEGRPGGWSERQPAHLRAERRASANCWSNPVRWTRDAPLVGRGQEADPTAPPPAHLSQRGWWGSPVCHLGMASKAASEFTATLDLTRIRHTLEAPTSPYVAVRTIMTSFGGGMLPLPRTSLPPSCAAC